MSYKEERAIKCLDWPSCSPDLSPIENLWAILKKRVQNRVPKTLEELKNYVKIEWETFDPDFIMNFTKSMCKRYDFVIAADGKRLIGEWYFIQLVLKGLELIIQFE